MSLQGEQLRFGYTPGRRVLDGVSVTLAPGRVTAIVGPNAAGKSTLLRLLAGLREPQSGSVLLDSQSIGSWSPARRARAIAYIPQQASVAFDFRLREVVAMGGFARPGTQNAHAVLIEPALHAVGLTDRSDDVFETLSAGQKQRAAIARALVQLGLRLGPAPLSSPSQPGHAGQAPHPEPSRYLLADEPISAMDPRHSLESLSLLRTIAAAGVGVVMVLHDLTLARRFADEALLIDASGRVVAHGPATQTLTPDRLDPVFAVAFTELRSAEHCALVATTRT